MSPESTCVLCGQKTKEIRIIKAPDLYSIECDICGRYVIDHLTEEGFKHLAKEDRAMISAFTRELSEFSSPPPELHLLDNERQTERIIERYRNKTIVEKLNKLILYLGRKSHFFGEKLKIYGENAYPITYSKDKEEFDNIFEHAKKIGLIEMPTSGGNAVLSWKGWEKFDSVKESGVLSKKCFVAMWCDEDLNVIYEEGVKKAVIEAGFEPIFIEKREHNEKICDLIIAEIRSCRFLVSDVTGQRPNVYYEAGFAHGLNRDVIWTCKEDDIDNAHFDTRQYNHIVWRDADDLRKKLFNRIKATII